MSPIRFQFDSVHDESLIISLGDLLGAPPENGVIKVPDPFGTGTIVRKELEEGLVLICWDFSLNAEVIFSKQLMPKKSNGRSLIINYLLSASDVVMESPSLKRKFQLKGGLNILLLPDDIDLNFEVKPGIIVKVVSVSVTPEWLIKEFANTQPQFTEYLQQVLHSNKPPVFLESSTHDEFRMLDDVVKRSLEIPNGILGLKPRISTVVADFMSRIYKKPIAEVLESRILHYQKMLDVEAILKAHIEKVLPDIETVARMVTLSVSTLKRHFKVVYGKGVYEYYLELKMEHAKRLLMERDISVNEVAFLLHYEKVSSFIDMFKKHQGYSPGTLKKRAS